MARRWQELVEDDIDVQILLLSKDGASKPELEAKLSVSRRHLRRHTAELVDKEFLRFDEKRQVLVTTHKGLLFLREKENA